MKLLDILNDVNYSVIGGSLDINIRAITQDSRKIENGSLFFANVGEKFDAHDFIENVIRDGAVAIVGVNVDKIDIKNHITFIKVENQRLALSKIASNFYKSPSKNLTMIGVTGTNGKTSTCKMLADALEGLSISTGIIGTIENRWGNHIQKATLTTPQPIELNELLCSMTKDDVQCCVMEVSSHALDLQRTVDIDYNYGVFTNLTEDHLDYHKNFENYFFAKSKLFDQVSSGRLIFCDNEYGKRLYDSCIEKNDNIRTWSYGLDASYDIYAKDIVYYKEKTVFSFVCPAGEVKLEIPLLGEIAVYNTLAALGIIYMMTSRLEDVKKASTNISAVSGRMEKVGCFNQDVFVDYSHTPDALQNALDIVNKMAKDRVIVVFGCGGNRDALKRPIMGKIAVENADVVFVTSDNPRDEDPNRIIDDILLGVDKQRNDKINVQVDRQKAIQMAINIAGDNDIVLIAGKGHETYQEIKGVRRNFDDRKIAYKALMERKD